MKISEKVAIVAKVKNPWNFKTPAIKLAFIIYQTNGDRHENRLWGGNVVGLEIMKFVNDRRCLDG